MAAGNGNARVVQALLSSGADPYAEGGGGVTALSMAVSGGALSDIDRPLLGGCYEPVVRLLLEKAPDLTLKHNFAGRSALWFARLKLMMAEDDERGCREVVSLIEKQEQKLAARAR
jgi:ankyrin repeat protein